MKLISFLLKYSQGIRHSRGILAIIIVTGILSGIFSTAMLAVINSGLAANGAYSRKLIWSFIALCLALPLTRFVSEVLLTHLTSRMILDLRLRLSRAVLAVPLRVLEELGPHRILAVLTDDIPTIANSLISIPVLCINAAVVIASLIYLGILSRIVLLALLFFIIVGVISYQIPMLKALNYFRLMRELSNTLYKHFRALTEGAKELKLHYWRREAFVTEHLQDTASSLQRYNVRGNAINTAANCWGQVLIFILIGLLLFALPGITNTSASTLSGYTLALLYIMTPLQIILTTMPHLGRAKIAMEKIEELGSSLTTGPIEPPPRGNSFMGGNWESLELSGVVHTYRSDIGNHTFTLGPIDLSFRPGELVFLVGGNGSGKTTFAKLFTGLYVPEQGEMRVDGERITDQNREAFRQQFSSVFADFYLFDSLLGVYNEDMDLKIQKYLAQLHLVGAVRIERGSLSTTELSRGQQKRLALLTAYIEDRPCYVFDEWAADQDPVFKEIFYYQLLPELKANGKTILAISHDDKYYHLADRIIKLDCGKLEYDRKAAETRSTAAEIPRLL